MNTATRNLYLAVDLEGHGARLDAPIKAVGLCLGDDAGQVLEKRLWVTDAPDSSIESQCRAEFWSKQPGLWQLLHSRGYAATQVFRDVAAYVDALESRFPATDIAILSDNPAYDVSRLDQGFATHAARAYGLRYTSTGQYRNVMDPSERFRALLEKEQRCWKALLDATPHDHMPDNDAEYIYILHVAVEGTIQTRESDCLSEADMREMATGCAPDG